MKQLFVRVMLICITTATSVFADSLDAALGVDRSSLSVEQIAARSDRLEASTSFSLLRFPEALGAPRRIFSPDIWRYIEAAAGAHDLDPMILAGMIFIESYGDPQAKSPTGPAGIAQMTKGSARELGLSTGKKGACRIEGCQENAMGWHGQEPAQGRADDPAADLQDDRRALRSRARNLGDGATREQSPVLARRPCRFRDSRVPHGRRPDGEAAVGVLRAHDPRS